ncbi:MAG TPA: transcriptional regulator, partial [Stenotrophomonas sp.]|nr:transcriptional regulator [Stenotrophomonas sp.]
QQALAEAGLSLPPGWMIESAPNRLEAAARTDELFADGHRPSAAVCYNDTVALGLMLGLNSRGIRPGGDFAVTGFDDISEASVAVPPLTTLTADPRERGRQAAALLLQRLDEPDAPPRRTVAPVQLRIRESSAARPN